jgi:hypothetical protein
MGGDRGIIKIVLGFRPTFIAAVVDWTELAMLITVETAKESGQEGEGDHDWSRQRTYSFRKNQPP